MRYCNCKVESTTIIWVFLKYSSVTYHPASIAMSVMWATDAFVSWFRRGDIRDSVMADGVHIWATEHCIYRDDRIVYESKYQIKDEPLVVCNRTGRIVFKRADDPTIACVVHPESDIAPTYLALAPHGGKFSPSGRLFYAYQTLGQSVMDKHEHCVYDTYNQWTKVRTVTCEAVITCSRVSDSDEMLYISTDDGIECHDIWPPVGQHYLIRYEWDTSRYLVYDIYLQWPYIAMAAMNHRSIFTVGYPHAITLFYVILATNRSGIWLPPELYEWIAREYLDLGPYMANP